MRGSFCHTKTYNVCSSFPLHSSKQRLFGQNHGPCNLKVWKSRPNQGLCLMQKQTNNGFVMGCASWGSVTELERELEAEMNSQEDGAKEWVGMARFRHKCGERKGVVELLECLEREAIMGEDVGKEPTDYNRRAQIFDRSSRVFQALKEHRSTSAHQSSE
ncbi:putative Voltage-dependent T-type calcium channel subunit alpha-1I [Quillaja saponaria]|uniref:Voltage-dependent T-type calcium channel subunit alpha-1I n=1 Tax=Quillaja saponaria TaxID=32244 RepID=A0AAD7LW35_QUISA|nr:putative Voltage-dependent T-type calcium channel subunit alpha-1I [Quillaja saponaria]